MTESGVGNLEEQALKRKERLALLKSKAQEQGKDGSKVFRNYKAQTGEEGEQISVNVELDVVTKEIQPQLDAMKTPIVVDEIDITNLAPRKPDWDLKRDVAKKLQTLEKRTQKAIAELIRDRLKGGQEDISQAVSWETGKKTDVDEE